MSTSDYLCLLVSLPLSLSSSHCLPELCSAVKSKAVSLTHSVSEWQGHLLSCPGQLNTFRYLARQKVPESFLVQKEFWRDILKQVFERFVHPALHPGKCWPVVASGSGLVRVNLLQEIKPKYQDIYKHTITMLVKHQKKSSNTFNRRKFTKRYP